ncbi:hypothetical protein [Paenibacillus sp. UASWS1643]|uniref:hypothetical protein n=1 Tax=Paenibacillus sp. UASWS1643 TaxID=2580422 RepID=UPI00123B9325|nr:hypothetical protein [Paenibacillus sp. UASWS1643]KAA8750096.1 hypothetical protein FE296_15985 [Paenibacillus sp. UASWS1643]
MSDLDKKQPEQAVEDAKRPGIKFPLSEPLVDGDTVHNELYLDYSKLNVRGLIAAESDLLQVLPAQEVATMILKATNFAYQMVVAARAAGITPDVMLNLNGPDALELGGQMQGFLLSRG